MHFAPRGAANATRTTQSPYSSSSFSHSSLRVGKHGTACQRSSSVTSPITAMVAACSASAISGPVKVAPTMTRRSSSTTMRAVPGAPRPTNDAAGVAAGRDVDGAGVDAGLLRAGEGVADGRDLRVGEGHARAEGAVAAQGDLAAEDAVGGDAALVLAHVGQQRAAVGIADDVEPVVAGDAQRVVDLDRASGLDAEVVDAEVGRQDAPAHGHEDLVAGHARAVVELDVDLAVLARDGRRPGVGADLDAGVGEGGAHLVARRTAPRGRARAGPPR